MQDFLSHIDEYSRVLKSETSSENAPVLHYFSQYRNFNEKSNKTFTFV